MYQEIHLFRNPHLPIMNDFNDHTDDWMNSFVEEPLDPMHPVPSITHNAISVPAGMQLPSATPPPQHHHHHQQQHHQQLSRSATASPQLMPSLQVQQVIRQPQPQPQPQLLRRPSNGVAAHSRSSSQPRPSTLNPASDGQRFPFLQQLKDVNERVLLLETKQQGVDSMSETLSSLQQEFKVMITYLSSFQALFTELGIPQEPIVDGTAPAS